MIHITTWTIVLLMALLVEMLTPSALVSIWFACGGLVALLFATAKLGWLLEILAFAAVSLCTLILLRPILSKALRGHISATNVNRLIGIRTRLTDPITPDCFGLVSLNGVIWRAKTYEPLSLTAGTLVEVQSIDGATLVVRPIEEK